MPPERHAKFEEVISLISAGNLAGAHAACQRLVQKFARHPDAHALMSRVLLEQGKIAQAEHHAGVAAALAPGFAPGETKYHLNAAEILMIAGKAAQACKILGAAAKSAPRDANVLRALADALMTLNQLTAALEACDAGLKIASGDVSLRSLRAAALLNLGRPEEAAQALRELCRDNPGQAPAASGLALVLNYVAEATAGEVFTAHTRYGDLLAAALPAEPVAWGMTRDPERRVRVGVVSPDLRAHSVAWFIEPWLEHHDRDAAEVRVYQTNMVSDATTERLKRHASAWRVVDRGSDADLARLMRADGVDIALDLSGHTHAHSLGAFHVRCAPVQATYMGYPNTTGVRAMDYRITDSTADPEGAQAFAVERLVRIDPCFLCYAPSRDAPGPERAAGRGRVFTFGSFNNAQKMNRRTIGLWARVLEATPGSRMLLKSVNFDDARLREEIAARFSAHGIDPSRVEVLARAPTLREHLALYQRFDVSLDTFPYAGTTTTCEALHMGVPVVTLRGVTHASRVGASILKAVGREDLIADTEEEYVRIAAGLAAQGEALDQQRAALRGALAGSPVCDSRGFAARFDGALRTMWKEWCRDG
ncbi:MAG: hypothetical protein KF859_11410 [Phycisphaeraceae bacterium]|nr:hypothetical protein [Phycisphaeraceae bacterium]